MKTDLNGFYTNIASRYDSMMNKVFFGIDRKYRKIAVNEMELKEGDVVLDLGCGTGLNFEYIHEKIGKKGRIIGVDQCLEMLEQAKKKKLMHKWSNIELIQQDIQELKINEKFDAILCFCVLSLVNRHKDTIRTASTYLKENGKFVIFDVKEPKNPAKLFLPLIKYIAKKFRSTEDDFTKRLWIDMMKYLKVEVKEYFFGLFYLAKGVKK